MVLGAAALGACSGSLHAPLKPTDAGADAPRDQRDAHSDSGRDVKSGRDAHRDSGRDAARDGVCVPLGAAAFRMQAPPSDAGYFYLFSLGDPGDGVWWYSVETTDGAVLPIFLPSSTETTCSSCKDLLEPIGQACAALPDGGVRGHWGGYAVTGEASCEVPATSSDPSHLAACATITCLPPGRYVVKMCASRGGCGYSSDAATCLSIPFDFPAASEVVGTLPL
jgi:hypothetical protein